MSDLPRYHAGGIGPIDFAKVNDMMQRLDRVLPLLENPSSRQASYGKVRLNPFLARTTKKIGGKFEWVEMTLDENGALAIDISPDGEGYSGRIGTQEEGTWAVCLDPDWLGGDAVCYALTDAAGNPGYVLCPLVESEPTFQDHPIALFWITDAYSDDTLSVDEDGDNSFDFNVNVYRYSGRKVSGPMVGGNTDLRLGQEYETVYDFGYHNPDPGLLNGGSVPWQYSEIPPGSFRTCYRLSNYWVIAGVPRLDYTCP